ncbi:hypothetical protein BC629DRAFT_1286261 [Irpex lacteus]|nr:hypothetical protein BC629DRAFT_1286261 [Irpex lacteus]
MGSHKGFRKCSRDTLWNGTPAHARRGRDGKLSTRNGRPLCTDFQRNGTCSFRGAKHVHECSGCGDKAHGACDCPLVKAD